MLESEYCRGFVVGLVTAGVLGYILQRIRLAMKTAGAADRKETVVETKRSPREAYLSSMRARTELLFWLTLLILLVIGVAWLYLS